MVALPLRLGFALALLFNAAVMAIDLEDLDYTITIRAIHVSNKYSSTGWSQIGDTMVFDQSAWNSTIDAVPVTTTVTAPGVCFHGKFDSKVSIAIATGTGTGQEPKLYDASNEGSTVCVTATYTENRFIITGGIRSLTSVGVIARIKGPPGATSDDVAMRSVPFLQDGAIIGPRRLV